MTTKGYIGSYTKEGKGIYLFELNEDSGQISSVNTGYEIEHLLILLKQMIIYTQSLKKVNTAG